MASHTVSRRAFLGSVAGGVTLSALARPTVSAWQQTATGSSWAKRSDRARHDRRRTAGHVAAARVPQATRHADRGHQRRRSRPPRSSGRRGREDPRTETESLWRLSPRARRSRDQRSGRRHARSLARDSDGTSVRSGQGRVRREALELQRGRGTHDGRRVAQVQARQPDGQSHPQRLSQLPARRRAREVRRARQDHARAHLEDLANGAGASDDQSADAASHARLRLLAWAGPETSVRTSAIALQLPVVLGLLRRDVHRFLVPHRRRGGLGARSEGAKQRGCARRSVFCP